MRVLLAASKCRYCQGLLENADGLSRVRTAFALDTVVIALVIVIVVIDIDGRITANLACVVSFRH